MALRGFGESWESCWVPLTSPPLQGYIDPIVAESWDGEASSKTHAVEVSCMNAMRSAWMIVIEL